MTENNEVPEEDSKARKKRRKKEKYTGLWGNIRLVVEALLIAAIIRTFFFQPFYIPSGSMKPNLLVGDYVIINKMAYGYSKWSCPFAMCPISGRIFGSDPDRGDVVVFANPADDRAFVKRLIGLPGDEITVQNGQVTLNGQEVPKVAIEDFREAIDGYRRENLAGCDEKEDGFCYLPQYEETYPGADGDVVVAVLDQSPNGRLDNTPVYTVPEGHYFVMGDNRDNSFDSRVSSQVGGVGFLPAERLIGEASLIVFSSAGASLFYVWDWRWDRLFSWVD